MYREKARNNIFYLKNKIHIHVHVVILLEGVLQLIFQQQLLIVLTTSCIQIDNPKHPQVNNIDHPQMNNKMVQIS